MCYYDETYPVEACKWNQKVKQITFIIIDDSQLLTKYYQILLRNFNWECRQVKHGTLDKTALKILTSL